MPAGDGTGPLGMGPMTGRHAGYGMPGYANPFPGRGFWGRGRGMGWGGGWCWRHWYYATGLPAWARWGAPPAWPVPPAAPCAAPPSSEQEIEFLRNQAEWLKGQLEAIEKHIAALQQE